MAAHATEGVHACDTDRMVHEVASYCRICAASCGIVATVDGDRVVAVRGDRDHPVSRGYTCPKGRALPALHHHPSRLDAPPAAWDAWLDDLASSLGAVVSEHGADAVAGYFGTGLAYDTAGWIAASGWLAAIGSSRLFTPATIDNAPVLLAAELVAGHPQANPVCDFDAAQLVLIVGSNPVVSHGYGTASPDPVTRLRAVRRRGGSVWVLDPRRSETAAIASHHLAVRPGSDALVLAWLVRSRLEAGVSAAVEATTAADDRARLAGALAGCTSARAARASGVPEPLLVELRDAVLAADGALAAWCGTGVTMSRDGLVAEWLRWVLLALSDSLDSALGMRFHRGVLFPLRGSRGPRPVPPVASRPELRRFLGQDPCVSFVDSVGRGDVRALVVAGANPLTAFPDAAATRDALRTLDVLAVADVCANELTATATHVLPVAAQLERADAPMHELVAVRGGSCFTPAVVPLGAARRPAWWVFTELARRMTGAELFGGASTDEDVLGSIAARARVPWATIRAAGPHGVEVEPEIGWVRDAVLGGEPWRIAPDALLERVAVLPDPPAFPLVLVPRRRMHTNNSVADPHGRDEPLVTVHPSDAAAASVTEGDCIVITSAHGSVTAVVSVDERVAPGVVSMSHGDAAASAGALVSRTRDVDPLTGMPRASGLPVSLSRV
jgi:anaerobic selenocysteine-containing dehydrogenase